MVNNRLDNETPEPEYSDADSVVYSVSVVLPEAADSEAVSAVIDSAVNDLHSGLDSSVGTHSVQKASSEDTRVYNHYAVLRKRDLLDSVNTLNTNIKNAKSSLSAEQQAACEAINAVKRSAQTVDDAVQAAEDELQEPGFSKKHALLGFILGAFLYAGIYVVMLILKKIVASAGTAQSYTGTRLLGEVYRAGSHKGLPALFTSAAVAKWRYKDKLDAGRQIDALASTVDAVCSHHGADRLTLLLSGVGSGFDDMLGQIADKRRAAGNKKGIDVINADEIDEKALNSVKNAAYVVCSNSKVNRLGALMSLCRDYDVTTLGTIYLEEL